MYYQPRHFRAEEWFSPEVVARHTHNNQLSASIWRLVDSRITWTMDAIRDFFHCTVVMNDYLWGGTNRYRGFRAFEELVDKVHMRQHGILRPTFSSFTSQHTMGRAADSKLSRYTAEEVRADIQANPQANRYKYVTAVEQGVSWLHIDVRTWQTTTSGILFFNP